MQHHLEIFDVAYSFDGRVILAVLRGNITNISTLPDSIFIDLNMPEFSGWDFLRDYHEISEKIHKKIDIYVVSSSTNPVHIRLAKAYPFVSNDLVKPLTKASLENILKLT